MINDFHSKGYEFLSNFYPAPVMYRGVMYSTVEHAFQAAKTLVLSQREQIRVAATPGIAKRLGRVVTLRAGWNSMRLEVMNHLLIQKFSDPELARKLIATGDQELIEGNNWHDTYWGVCNGVGENHLGKLLMEVRRNLRTNHV